MSVRPTEIVTTADLIQRKLTWGDYAKKRKVNYDDAVQLLGGVSYFAFEVVQEVMWTQFCGQDVLNALTRYYQSLQIVSSMHRKSAKPSS